MGRSTNHHVTSSSVEHDADKRKNSLDEPESESQSEEDVDELLEDEHANTSSANLAHKNAASCTESDGPKASASQDACTACHSAGRPDACVVERGSSGRRRTCKICWEKKRRCSFSGYERKVTKGKGASTGKEKKRPNAAFRDVADASSSLSAVDAKGKGKVIPTRPSDEAELDAQYSTKKRKGEERISDSTEVTFAAKKPRVFMQDIFLDPRPHPAQSPQKSPKNSAKVRFDRVAPSPPIPASSSTAQKPKPIISTEKSRTKLAESSRGRVPSRSRSSSPVSGRLRSGESGTPAGVNHSHSGDDANVHDADGQISSKDSFSRKEKSRPGSLSQGGHASRNKAPGSEDSLDAHSSSSDFRTRSSHNRQSSSTKSKGTSTGHSRDAKGAAPSVMTGAVEKDAIAARSRATADVQAFDAVAFFRFIADEAHRRVKENVVGGGGPKLSDGIVECLKGLRDDADRKARLVDEYEMQK